VPDLAEQNFPSGDIKIVAAGHTESRADYTAQQEQYQPAQVFAFPGEEISAVPHTVEILFTKFTFLFTILVLRAEKYQSNFAESNGYDMKNNRKILSGLLIMLAGVNYLPVQAQQKQEDSAVVYQLDIKKSKLFWKAPKNRHIGFILFNSGTLSNFIDGKPTQGTFSINMNSMRSTDETSANGRKEVDDKLRSEEFFAVSKYPAATMVVSKIVSEPGKATSRVYGKLTIKNVTKPIEFTTIMKQNGNTITARANINISRANWNINHQPEPASWNLFERLQDKLVDDDIPVSLELVFTKK
jgi:polyisoprenoid-binding protein YceI